MNRGNDIEYTAEILYEPWKDSEKYITHPKAHSNSLHEEFVKNNRYG